MLRKQLAIAMAFRCMIRLHMPQYGPETAGDGDGRSMRDEEGHRQGPEAAGDCDAIRSVTTQATDMARKPLATAMRFDP